MRDFLTRGDRGPKGLGGIEMRQRKLRDDHLAEVLSPFLVRCKRCQREIKLSAKSQYDPHHWTTHRKRCAKPARSDGVAVTKRAAAGKPKVCHLIPLPQALCTTNLLPNSRRRFRNPHTVYRQVEISRLGVKLLPLRSVACHRRDRPTPQRPSASLHKHHLLHPT